jgi:hypothetical protein
MTPDEAEAEAQGFGPLAGVRDPERFDPIKADRWTIPMTVAWIAWRDLAKVRKQMPTYRREYWIWLRYDKGSVLEQQPEASVLDERLNSESEDYQRLLDAKEELWRRLQNRDLVATGVELDKDRPKEIPDFEWLYLTLQGEDKRPNSVSAPNRHARGLRRGLAMFAYDDILVKRKDVLSLWRPRRPEKDRKVRKGQQQGPKEAALREFVRTRFGQDGIPSNVSNTLIAEQYRHWASNDRQALALSVPVSVTRPYVANVRKKIDTEVEQAKRRK